MSCTTKNSLLILVILCGGAGGFLIFPFTAQTALDTFLKAIESRESVNENVMKNAIPGQMCLRECKAGVSRVCHFKFRIKYYQVLSGACNECMAGNMTACLVKKCVTADGFQRGFLSINFQLPGPTISVCKDDIVVVDVLNEAEGIATSFHWHGIRQAGSQFSDGVPYLTQCPVPYNSQYRYIFRTDEAGTHFYHSHSGNQKADGLHGALIVRDESEKSSIEDLPQHVIFAADWMHDYSDNYLPGMAKRSALTEAILINGRGRFRYSNGEYSHTPLTIFYVERGKRYRFRLINGATNVCPYQLQIEAHNFTIVGSELSRVRPFVADTLHYLSGERYEIVLDANREDVRDYWIRIRETEPCWKKIEGFAILRYQETKVKYTQPKIVFTEKLPPEWGDEYPKGILFNSPKPKVEDTPFTALEAFDNGGDDEILTTQPDYVYHLFIDSPAFLNSIMYKRKNLNDYTFLTSELISNASFVATINNVTLQYPVFPLLLEPDLVNDSLFCNGHTLQDRECLSDENATVCKCIHRLKVDLGSKVEFIVYNIKDKISHPLHLHGHKFQVTDSGVFADPNDTREANVRLDLRGRKLPYKDTAAVPFPGYVRFRFRANNPGYWLMHCHFDWHLSIGMALIVQVGEINQMPRPKHNVPRCHPYTPVSMK